MEQLLVIIAMASFGGSILIIIGSILNSGIKGVLSKDRQSSKWAIGLFIFYLVSFSVYLLISN